MCPVTKPVTLICLLEFFYPFTPLGNHEKSTFGTAAPSLAMFYWMLNLRGLFVNLGTRNISQTLTQTNIFIVQLNYVVIRMAEGAKGGEE